jgi:desulfoferrodoxin-like iron-binding protein
MRIPIFKKTRLRFLNALGDLRNIGNGILLAIILFRIKKAPRIAAINSTSITFKEICMDDKKAGMTRRDFLNTAVAGAAVLAAGSMFEIAAKDEPASSGLKIFVCSICGHVEFGSAPDKCPVCHAGKEEFKPNNSLFSDAMAKLKDGAHNHSPVLTVKKEAALVMDVPCKEISVRVGKDMHPMEEAHHIAYIDWYMDDKFVNRFFTPIKLYPAVSIYVKTPGAKVRAVSWCNLHGYWQAESAI